MITTKQASGTISNQYKKDSDKLVCKVCGKEVDYLIGEDTPDGGVQGCDLHWKQPTTPQKTNEDIQMFSDQKL